MAARLDEQRRLLDLLVPRVFRIEILRVMANRWEHVLTQKVDIFDRLPIFKHFLIWLEKLTFTKDFFHALFLFKFLLFKRPSIN